jgi:hypothetical protein
MLGTIIRNKNSIQKETEMGLKSKRDCCNSMQNLLSSSLKSKNIKNKIYRIITLPVVLYWCENCLLTLRGKRRLRVIENRVLRRIFGTKRDEVTGDRRNLSNE